MHFPPGLSARLIRRRISASFRATPVPAIFHLPLTQPSCAAASSDQVADCEWRTLDACVEAAAESRAPIVWLGGREPLSHPNIADVASALVTKGHYVFFHTSGEGLRRRVHEFQPVPRLYLTFEIPLHSGGPEDSWKGSGSDTSIRAVAECIRAARLSGFYVCGHFTIGNESSPAQLVSRIREFSERGLDGLAISSRGVTSGAESNAPSPDRLDEFTRLIPSLCWRKFSRLLESSHCRPVPSREFAASTSRAENACEESA